MLVVGVRVEQADRDRRDAEAGDALGDPPGGALVQRGQDGAVGGEAFGDLEGVGQGHRRLARRERQVAPLLLDAGRTVEPRSPPDSRALARLNVAAPRSTVGDRARAITGATIDVNGGRQFT